MEYFVQMYTNVNLSPCHLLRIRYVFSFFQCPTFGVPVLARAGALQRATRDGNSNEREEKLVQTRFI